MDTAAENERWMERVIIQRRGAKGKIHRYACNHHAPGLAERERRMGSTVEIAPLPEHIEILRICLGCIADESYNWT